MLESMKEYTLLWAVLGISLLGCIFLWYLAMKSSQERTRRRNEEIARLTYERELREEFANPTQQLLIDTPPARLIEGLSSNVQTWLEAQPDMRAAFHALPEQKRWVYALGFLVQESREALSEFFRKNGDPLTTAAMEAVQMIIGGEFAEVFNQEFAAYDNDNEEVSLLDKEILLLDARFHALLLQFGENVLYAEIKEHILSNSIIFLVNIE